MLSPQTAFNFKEVMKLSVETKDEIATYLELKRYTSDQVLHVGAFKS